MCHCTECRTPYFMESYILILDQQYNCVDGKMVDDHRQNRNRELHSLSVNVFLVLPSPILPSRPPHHCLYKRPALMVPILKLQIATTKVCVATDPVAKRLLTWIFYTKTYGRSYFFPTSLSNHWLRDSKDLRGWLPSTKHPPRLQTMIMVRHGISSNF